MTLPADSSEVKRLAIADYVERVAIPPRYRAPRRDFYPPEKQQEIAWFLSGVRTVVERSWGACVAIGTVGCGKSHLMSLAVAEAAGVGELIREKGRLPGIPGSYHWWSKLAGRWYAWGDVVAWAERIDLRRSVDEAVDELDGFAECPLAFVDDFAPITGYVGQRLARLTSGRLDRRATVFTGNFTVESYGVDQVRGAWGAIGNRLVEAESWVELVGESNRKPKPPPPRSNGIAR